MRVFFAILFSSTITLGSLHLANAQDLAPRVYVITPFAFQCDHADLGFLRR